MLGALALVTGPHPALTAADPVPAEYTRFAELFSMQTKDGYLKAFRQDAPRRAEAAAALKPADGALAKAAKEFDAVALLYASAQKVLDRATFTPEEQRRMQELGRAGFNGDDPKMAEYLAAAVAGLANEARAVQVSTKIIDEALVRHAAAWKAVAPLAKKYAGPKATGAPLKFSFVMSRQAHMSYGLTAVNESGRALNNVTLVVSTAVSASLPAEARTYYVFHREWKAGEAIGLRQALVDAFTKEWVRGISINYTAPRPTPGCLTYSVYADQLSQEAVELDMGLPEPTSPGAILTPRQRNTGHMFRNSNEREGTLHYAFHRHGEPQYDPAKPDLFVAGSVWTGKTGVTAPKGVVRDLNFIVTSRSGAAFKAEVRSGTIVVRTIEGSVANGKIEWKDVPQKGVRSHGPPVAGEINGTRIEGTYSESPTAPARPGRPAKAAEGFVSLEYNPPPEKK
ncbi:hypothetical protein FRUB_02106 [Fimbriiglobus ruber]|uniref:Uncharacterized protein n=2 Tax=Fimbriiglobus ruber TaxID=1908690 RepID=A0A225EB63_9BACT|nr:hypothetical protein FRUB_02106 [Fimbriiglobus ruber]